MKSNLIQKKLDTATRGPKYYTCSISQKENSSKKESKKDIKKIEKSKDEEEKDHSLSTSNVDSSPCCSSTQFGILTSQKIFSATSMKLKVPVYDTKKSGNGNESNKPVIVKVKRAYQKYIMNVELLVMMNMYYVYEMYNARNLFYYHWVAQSFTFINMEPCFCKDELYDMLMEDKYFQKYKQDYINEPMITS